MSERLSGLDRRGFMKSVGIGAAFTVGAGASGGALGKFLLAPASAATTSIALAATDGYMRVPGRGTDWLYIFGFIPVDPNASVSSLMSADKGHAQTSAPHLGFLQNDDIQITLTNLGLVQRPDLTDSHTIHWHGFDVPSPLNDGVPEVSVAVPIGKQLTYFYRPHREGTYMYHCHFEDVEHVHMGMQGIVFVRPQQDGTTITTSSGTFSRFAYNDRDGSTGYHRHFAILLNEVWAHFHDGDRDIQETIPTDYDPQWFTMNGRCYPDTVRPNNDPTFTTPNPNYDDVPDMSQPNSSLIQINPGERGLIRLANLGYQQHALELPGITMNVVGQDASLLRDGTEDLSYRTNTLYVGPGEARDVLFDAPAYDAARPSGSDAKGPYNVYHLKNRDWRRLSNLGTSGPGGMQTEVRVYQNPLPDQTVVSQTYV
jgi:FtsP/CotA-like multicopper oxidase with cupredoxin domain